MLMTHHVKGRVEHEARVVLDKGGAGGRHARASEEPIEGPVRRLVVHLGPRTGAVNMGMGMRVYNM